MFFSHIFPYFNGILTFSLPTVAFRYGLPWISSFGFAYPLFNSNEPPLPFVYLTPSPFLRASFVQPCNSLSKNFSTSLIFAFLNVFIFLISKNSFTIFSLVALISLSATPSLLFLLFKLCSLRFKSALDFAIVLYLHYFLLTSHQP